MEPGPKVLFDPIHGHMEFHPILVKIIDTPQFQRLRYIKQLGGAYFVYPGASHNRFEHSLGTAHLAGKLVRSLKEKQTDLGIDDRDVLCVEIAGLCHDLGHGPFSHMFDGKFIPKSKYKPGWKHEKASLKMFDQIVDSLNLSQHLNVDDIMFIKEMINGPIEPGRYEGRSLNKSFLYEIISNKRNGIDVDKFDYFARDCHHLGIKNSFDHNRYIQFAKVFEVDGKWQICTRDKELPNVYEMFHARSSLYRKACFHKTKESIELMITDALLKADKDVNPEGENPEGENQEVENQEVENQEVENQEVENQDVENQEVENQEVENQDVENQEGENPEGRFQISRAIDDMDDYLKLTDDIFEKICYSDGPELADAREILQNVLFRKLPKYLGNVKMTEEPNAKTQEKWKTELAQQSTYHGENPLTADDFEFIISRIDFGMKDQNPMESLYVYNKFNIPFKIPSDQVSQFLLPNEFSEKWINVYCKNMDNVEVAQRNFYEWGRRKNLYLPPISGQREDAPQSKVFNDPIHGHMEFDLTLVKIIDTPEFQRLRFIKQQGAAYFVYPGASHNRFEHALGVAHLAGQFLKRLKEEHEPISDEDILCVQIAALCLDIGRAPFSDGVMLDQQNINPSAVIFQTLENNLHLNLNEADKTFIEEMITGEGPQTGRPEEKRFLYDILGNRTNGVGVAVGVKLFDYVARDCYNTGLEANFDHRRVIQLAKVIQVNEVNKICFSVKVLGNMFDLWHTIVALHSKVYQHRVTKNIKTMIPVDERAKTDNLLFARHENIMQEIHSHNLLYFDLPEVQGAVQGAVQVVVPPIHIRQMHFYDMNDHILTEDDVKEEIEALNQRNTVTLQ